MEEEIRRKSQLTISASGVLGTCYSILGGLSFSSSVLILTSWREKLQAGDLISVIIAMLALISTLFFVFGSLFCAFAALHARLADQEYLTNACHLIQVAQFCGAAGFFPLFTALVGMAFYMRWELAIGVLATLIFIYAYAYKYLKKHKARVFVIG